MNHLRLVHPESEMQVFRALRDLVPLDGVIVEVGCYVGVVTATFGEIGTRKVYAVDPWHWDCPTYDETDGLMEANRKDGGGAFIFKTFCQNCGDKLYKNIFPLRAYSDEAAEIFPFQIDMVYIDGDHRYEAVKKDIAIWLPKVKSGGYIAGDDYFGTSVAKAVDEMLPDRQILNTYRWVWRKP